MVQLQQDPRPQCPSLAPTTRPTVLEENLVTTEPTPNHFHHAVRCLSLHSQSVKSVASYICLCLFVCHLNSSIWMFFSVCLSYCLSVCLFPSIIVRPSVSPFVCKTSFCLFVWLSVCLIITDLMKIKIKDNYWFTVWKMAGISCGFTFITRSKSLYINSYCIQFLSFIFYIQML